MLAASNQLHLAPSDLTPRLRALLLEKARRVGHPAIMREYCRSLDFEPDLWQLELLCSRQKRLACLTGRQSGKSTVMALRAALEAASGSRSDTLIVAPTLRQAKELFLKAKDFINHPNAKLPTVTAEAGLSLEYASGSRIIALPGAPRNIRGFSAIRAVICDEAAFIPSGVFTAMSPMLAVSGGSMILGSTAWLPEGYFYEAMETNPDWIRWKVSATENPRIDANFLAQEERAMGAAQFAAEYLCQWLPSSTFAIFDPQLVEEATNDWAPVLDWEMFKWD